MYATPVYVQLATEPEQFYFKFRVAPRIVQNIGCEGQETNKASQEYKTIKWPSRDWNFHREGRIRNNAVIAKLCQIGLINLACASLGLSQMSPHGIVKMSP